MMNLFNLTLNMFLNLVSIFNTSYPAAFIVGLGLFSWIFYQVRFGRWWRR